MNLFRLTVIATLGFISSCYSVPKLNSWTMIDVTEGSKQADSHLIVFGENHFDLIDTGFTGKKILPFLKNSKINQIKNIFISHPHKDHYGGVQPILESGVKVENLWINVPSKSFCDTEKPWGCDYEHIQSVIALAKSKGVNIKSMKAGDLLDQSASLQLKALAAYQDTNSPTGRQGGINDTSVLMKLTGAKLSVLFTGDLNIPLGGYLATHMSADVLHADLLKVPHHGTEGCAPDSFFDRVNPIAAFVPGPKDLWLSDRSKRIREYWEKSGKKFYVSGIDGDVSTDLGSATLTVTTHKPWWATHDD